jgi:nicotinate-nucleotide--dimethylbenzimidazole phosphoribosyltransferase
MISPDDLPRAEPDDPTLLARLAARLDAKTKPAGSLGRLEDLAARLGAIQGTDAPTLRAPHLMVFAGDHGVAAEGVSAYPREVTWQMVMNLVAGGAAACVLARANGMALSVIDAGVDHDFGVLPGLVDRKIASGTANLAVSAAMTVAQCDAALDAGAQLARDRLRQGCNVIAFGEMGIANTTAASALAARFTALPLADLVGRGSGVDDATLARKEHVVARALALHAGATAARDALAALGGFEIAMIAGAMLAAAQARAVIVVDGFVVTAALLAARAIDPTVTRACVYSHLSGERGHRAVLAHLGATPLLDLGLRLGEGSGAALALPLLRAAVAILADMATFDSAGVASRRCEKGRA